MTLERPGLTWVCDVCGKPGLQSLMIQHVGCGHRFHLEHEGTRPGCPACLMERIRKERGPAGSVNQR